MKNNFQKSLQNCILKEQEVNGSLLFGQSTYFTITCSRSTLCYTRLPHVLLGHLKTDIQRVHSDSVEQVPAGLLQLKLSSLQGWLSHWLAQVLNSPLNMSLGKTKQNKTNPTQQSFPPWKPVLSTQIGLCEKGRKRKSCKAGRWLERSGAQEMLFWCQPGERYARLPSHKGLNISRKNNNGLPLQRMEQKKKNNTQKTSIIPQEFLDCKKHLLVSIRVPSWAPSKGLLPGSSLLPSIHSSKKMRFEAIKTYLWIKVKTSCDCLTEAKILSTGHHNLNMKLLIIHS